MRLSSLFLSFLLAAASVAQPAAFRGVVVEAGDQPVVGASIVLRVPGESAPAAGTAADADGRFLIAEIVPGRYQLVVSAIGFAPYEEALDLEPGARVERRIVLRPEASDLGEVVVEAGRPGGVRDATAGAQRAEAENVALIPVPGGGGDLAAYLQTVPGFTAVGERGGQLFVRGGEPTQNLALLDGMPIYAPLHVIGLYSAYPAEVIGDAQLFTAGYGAAYGGRVSAVLDVTTRTPSMDGIGGSVSLAPFLSGIQAEGPIVPGRISALVSVRESVLERLTPKLFGEKMPYRFGDRIGKVHARFGPATLAVTGLHTSDDGEVAANFRTLDGSPPPPGSDRADSTRIRWENAAVATQLRLAPSGWPFAVEASAGYSETRSTFVPALSATSGTKESVVGGFVSRLRVLGGRDAVRWECGLFGRRARYAYRLPGLFAGLPGADSTLALDDEAVEDTVRAFEGGGYAQVEVRPLPQISIEGGVRAHYYGEAERLSWEPRARVAWRPPWPYVDEVAVVGGLYRQGEVGLRDGRNLGDVFVAYVPVRSDQPLPSAYHGAVSVRGGLGERLAVLVEGFVKRFPTLLVPTLSAIPEPATALARAEGDAYGVDLRLEHARPFWHESDLQLQLGYGWSEVRYETDRDGRYAPPHDQRHRVLGFVRAERDGYALSATLQYGSGFAFTPSLGVDRFVPVPDPSTDVTSVPGQVRVLYGDRGSARLPAYRRVDVWFERSLDQDGYRAVLRAGAVNALGRDNLFYYDLLSLRRVNQLPLIPVVAMTVTLL
jgi:hypothetical protein